MPKTHSGDLTQLVGVRFSPELLAKLDQLALSTYRDRSDVLRLLVEEAKLMPKRDIRMRAPVEPLAPETVDVAG
jgi:hypothetical protein